MAKRKFTPDVATCNTCPMYDGFIRRCTRYDIYKEPDTPICKTFSALIKPFLDAFAHKIPKYNNVNN